MTGRATSVAALAAAAATALVLRAGHSPWPAWAAGAAVGGLALWWSAPRARAPGLAGRAAFVLASLVLAASAPTGAAWPLALTGLALAVGLLPPRTGEGFAAVGAAAVFAGAAGRWALSAWSPSGAVPAGALHELPSLLTLTLALTLGASVGLLRRERAARRDESAALLQARYQAESLAEHLQFMLAATGRTPPPPPGGTAPGAGTTAADTASAPP